MPFSRVPSDRRETAFAASLRAAMPGTDGFNAIADSLGIPYESLKAACAEHRVLVVGSNVLDPMNTLLTHSDLAGGEAWPMGDDRPTSGADMVDFACELHRSAVKAIAATGLDMSVLVARSTDEDGNPVFWSANEGWIDAPTNAAVFYGYELHSNKLPEPPGDNPAEWKPFAAACAESEQASNPSRDRG